MNTKNLLLSAAALGLMVTVSGCASSGSGDSTSDSMAMGECHGVNSCKGTGDCGGKGYSCAGKNSCKGKGWLKMSKVDCVAKSGKFSAK